MIEHVPNDVILCIFDELDPRYVAAAEKVCKRWNILIRMHRARYYNNIGGLVMQLQANKTYACQKMLNVMECLIDHLRLLWIYGHDVCAKAFILAGLDGMGMTNFLTRLDMIIPSPRYGTPKIFASRYHDGVNVGISLLFSQLYSTAPVEKLMTDWMLCAHERLDSIIKYMIDKVNFDSYDTQAWCISSRLEPSIDDALFEHRLFACVVHKIKNIWELIQMISDVNENDLKSYIRRLYKDAGDQHTLESDKEES